MAHDFKQVFFDYIDSVNSGSILACKWEKLAVKRFENDLKRHEFTFDIETGLKWCNFCTLLNHQTGTQFAGQPFIPEPFQVFILVNLFGWKWKETGYRRFRDVYIEIPRKNGKSFLASSVALGGLTIDRESSAQVYSAATTRDQARIVFEESKKMVRGSNALQNHLGFTRDSIFSKSGYSYFKPLSSDSKTMDGLNVHMAIIDELHAHKDSGVVDLIGTARGARKQPIVFEITTAGSDKGSICYKHHELTKKVLQGVVTLDTWFGVIYTLDEGDDWKESELWKKANPNLNVSKEFDYMKAEFDKAIAMPSHVNTFQRLDLNIWTGSVTRWISDEAWIKCNDDYTIEDLKGLECVAGMDLASVGDTNAITLVFRCKDGKIRQLNYFFVPEETKHGKYQLVNIDYPQWVELGDIIQTSKPSRDDSAILQKLVELSKIFNIKMVVSDRWQAEDIVYELENNGFNVFAFGQGFKSMSYPTKEMEKMIINKELLHNGNRCMRWQVSNIMLTRDPADNVKIDKAKSTDKVDGPVSLVMALAGLLEIERTPVDLNYAW